MKLSRAWIAVLLITSVTGCHSVADSNLSPGDFDPILQVTPLVGAYQYEHGQRFDVGVAIFRTQQFDGSQPSNDPATARMAFAQNGYPVQVDTAIVNGVTLAWFPDAASSLSSIYSKEDSNAYGAPDSMTFTYLGFAGGRFTTTIGIAPSFGRITYSDTVSVALGCAFRYEHAVPEDSIEVRIQNSDPGGNIKPFGWTIPDTGGFIIQPHQLSYIPNGSINQYTVDIYRVHWEALTSPNVKRIGIYSWQGTANLGFNVKP